MTNYNIIIDNDDNKSSNTQNTAENKPTKGLPIM